MTTSHDYSFENCPCCHKFGSKRNANFFVVVFALFVPAGSPSRGGDVTVCVLDINQPSLPIPFYSVLVSFSLLMALSTVFHSINSPDNSPFLSLFFRSYSASLALFTHISLSERLLQPWYNP